MRTRVKIGSVTGDEKRRPVVVEVHLPEAKEVFIGGSFNQWQIVSGAMRAMGEGWWSYELLLPPGKHEYRFVVDGKWVSDPFASEHVRNPHGTFNSTLIVPDMGESRIWQKRGLRGL